MQLLREIKILGVLYSFSGLYCSAFAAWIFHWMATTGGWGFLIMPFTGLLPPCFAFFVVTYGVLKCSGWARTLGFILSGGTVALMLLSLPAVDGVVRYLLGHPESYLMGTFLLSSLALLVANALCIYYLTRPQVTQYMNEESRRARILLNEEIRNLCVLLSLRDAAVIQSDRVCVAHSGLF